MKKISPFTPKQSAYSMSEALIALSLIGIMALLSISVLHNTDNNALAATAKLNKVDSAMKSFDMALRKSNETGLGIQFKITNQNTLNEQVQDNFLHNTVTENMSVNIDEETFENGAKLGLSNGTELSYAYDDEHIMMEHNGKTKPRLGVMYATAEYKGEKYGREYTIFPDGIFPSSGVLLHCDAPRIRNSNGKACICPEPRTNYDESTNTCNCPSGHWNGKGCVTCISPRTQWNEDSLQCECPAPKIQWDEDSNECVCPAGSYGDKCTTCSEPKQWDESTGECICVKDKVTFNSNEIYAEREATCKMTCPGNQIANADHSACKCLSGSHWNGSSCVTCISPKTQWNEDSLQCECPAPKTFFNEATNQCECPSGKHWNGSICVTCISPKTQWNETSKQCVCPAPKTYFNENTNQCECPSGSHWNGSTCVICTAPKTQWNSSTKQCECPTGTHWNGSTCVTCTAPKTQWNNTTKQCECPSGTHWNGSTCVTCTAPKTQWNNTTKQCECPTGSHWNGSTCVTCTAPKTQWNETTKQCVCPGGKTYNSKTNTCEDSNLKECNNKYGEGKYIPISTPEELAKIGNVKGYSSKGTYCQTQNIDLSKFDSDNDKNNGNWAPLPMFQGTYDGNNKKISNMKIVLPSTNYVGLFSQTTRNANLLNIGLEKVDVMGNFHVGGLTGAMHENSAITNSHATGIVTAVSQVGGLTGDQYKNSTITNSYAQITVTGAEYVGGLVALMSDDAIISNSYATGAVTGTDYVGGLAGVMFGNATITKSYATSTVMGTSYVGGVVGYHSRGTISNSYSTGAVTGDRQVGGLSGGTSYNSKAETNSYATGVVVGNESIGGFVGGCTKGNIVNSFYDRQTTGMGDKAVDGKAYTGVTPLTTAEMKTPAKFAAWDKNIWQLTQGKYPKLKNVGGQ